MYLHVCVYNLTCTDLCMHICVYVYVDSGSPLAFRDMFPDPQWMSESADSTKPSIYYVVSLDIQTYDRV